MNSSVRNKMRLLTRRQFIEWSPAMLAIMLSKGKFFIQRQLYIHCRKKIMSDGIFMEKIKLLVGVVAFPYTPWLSCVDKSLPHWMFRDIADILLDRLKDDIEMIASIFYHIRDVDNILYILSKGVGREFIAWPNLDNKDIRRLLPWVTKEVIKGRLSDVQRAILGVGLDNLLIHRYEDVRKIMKYSDYAGIWEPITLWDFDGIKVRGIRSIIKAGWKIILHLYLSLSYNSNDEIWLKAICDIIIAAGSTDLLFGEKNYMRENNLKIYEFLIKNE